MLPTHLRWLSGAAVVVSHVGSFLFFIFSFFFLAQRWGAERGRVNTRLQKQGPEETAQCLVTDQSHCPT